MREGSAGDTDASVEKTCLGDGRLFVGGRGAGRSQRRTLPQTCKERQAGNGGF